MNNDQQQLSHLRITFFIDSFGRGGKERRCLQLIQGLNARGIHDIQLIIADHFVEYDEIYETSAQVEILSRREEKKSNLQIIKEAGQLIAQFKPDIVMAWGLMCAFFTDALMLRQRFKYIIAYIADCNEPRFPSKNFFVNTISKRLCDKAVGNSQAGLEAYGIPDRKRYCVYNGFNISRLDRIKHLHTERYQRDILKVDTRYIVTMVAGVDRRKDYQAFIETARRIAAQRSDVTFLYVGKGRKMDEALSLLREEDKGIIRFLGFREDVEEILACSSLSLLLTNYHEHAEGISNSILESMAIGTPVIATRGGGSAEIIADGQNGYLVDNNDITIICNHIYELLDDPSKRHQMGEACRQQVEQKFSLEATTQQYIDLFREVVF